MAPQAQPIVTVDEIDEALWWVVLTAPRDRHYGRIIDALLDERNRLEMGHPPSPPPRVHPDQDMHTDHPRHAAR
jgi:hypothetical protein